MNAHFSPAEFVDFADGVLPAARASHADRCDECRTQAMVIGTIARDAAAIEMPEPSPLFWHHFQQRLASALDAEPAPRGAWAWLHDWPRRQALIGATVLLVTLSGTWAAREYASHRTPPPPQAGVMTVAESDATVDSPWDILSDMAAEMPIEDARAAGLSVRPAAVDTAVQGMTQDERNELGRLLQDELKHSAN